jgi:hypothetical protein
VAKIKISDQVSAHEKKKYQNKNTQNDDKAFAL